MRDIKTVIISALPEELDHQKDILGLPIIYSGVGKINAASAVTSAFHLGYNKIINIGSAGSLKHEIGTILEIGVFKQDIDCTPLCEYGRTYGEIDDIIILNNHNEISCFTTDTFFDYSQHTKYSESYLENIEKCDFFDMESYSIAKICKKFSLEFICYKWVSDSGNSVTWEFNKKINFEKIKQLIESGQN